MLLEADATVALVLGDDVEVGAVSDLDFDSGGLALGDICASSGAPPRRKARDSDSDASQPSDADDQTDIATVVEVPTDEDESEPESEEEFELSGNVRDVVDKFIDLPDSWPLMRILIPLDGLVSRLKESLPVWLLSLLPPIDLTLQMCHHHY